MLKEEIMKIILKNLNKIIETAIELGYYTENQRKEIEYRILHNVKNGIMWCNENPEIYGVFVADRQAIYLNDEVLKDELTVLIYFAHELIHAIDFDGKNQGFKSGDDNIGIGIEEGATQRKAETIVKKILNIKPVIKEQESIGCKLETDLDEYQIEDKFNQLYAKALGISFEHFLKLQGKSNNEGSNYIKKLDALYYGDIFDQSTSRSDIIPNIDEIYKLQEKTWHDKNYDVNRKTISYEVDNFGNMKQLGHYSRDEILKQIQDDLVRLFVYRNIMEEKINNEEEYKELVQDFISGFILKDNSYLNNYQKYLKNIYFNNSSYIKYQNQYNEIESWILKNVDFGNSVLVSINLEYEDNIETIIGNQKTIYIRENEKYFTQQIKIEYDQNGNLRYYFSEKKECFMEDIVNHMLHNECDGNYMEYISLLEKMGNYTEAKRVLIRHTMFEKRKYISIDDTPTNDSDEFDLESFSNLAQELLGESFKLPIFSDDDFLAPKL